MSSLFFIIKNILLWVFLIWFVNIMLDHFNAPAILGQIGLFIIAAHFLEKFFKWAEKNNTNKIWIYQIKVVSLQSD